MGYAGGQTKDPTYHNIGTHAEAVTLTYDPERIGLSQLLDLFWSRCDPTRYDRRSQYRAMLFCDNEVQFEAARESARRLGKSRGCKVRTEIVLRMPFYPAEDYHQKWYLRRHPKILADLQRHYEDEAALLASVAATKMNAYLGGGGSMEQIERDGRRFGLSEEQYKRFRKRCLR